MEKVQFYGCYDFNKEWYLVEMMIDESSDDVDLYEFVVPEPELAAPSSLDATILPK